MKLSNQGFTLIELISVSVIVFTLILFISSSLSGTLSLREIQSDIQLSQAGASHAELSRLIKNFFSRGRDISLTRIPIVFLGNTLNATALVLRADLRACNTFNPATTPTNLSRIGISCCAPNLNIPAPIPGGGTVILTTACGNNWGLTVTQWAASGALVSRRCFQNITALNIFNLGPQPLATNTNTLNFDLTSETHFINNLATGRKLLFDNFSVFLGNTLNAPLVTCSRLGQFN